MKQGLLFIQMLNTESAEKTTSYIHIKQYDIKTGEK